MYGTMNLKLVISFL